MGASPRSATTLPLFRSEAQGRILAAVFLAPERESRHLTAIAELTGLPFSTVQREVSRLEQAGLVCSERFAQARVVRASEDSPYTEALRSLLLRAYGPTSVLPRLLPRDAGIRAAYVFGSWAARYAGEPGPAPGDVDLLVVGAESLDLEQVRDACSAAETMLGREINLTVVGEDAWRHPDSGFLRTIKKRPLVELELEPR